MCIRDSLRQAQPPSSVYRRAPSRTWCRQGATRRQCWVGKVCQSVSRFHTGVLVPLCIACTFQTTANLVFLFSAVSTHYTVIDSVETFFKIDATKMCLRIKFTTFFYYLFDNEHNVHSWYIPPKRIQSSKLIKIWGSLYPVIKQV